MVHSASDHGVHAALVLYPTRTRRVLRERRSVTHDGTRAQETYNQTGDMVKSAAPMRRATADATIMSHSSAAKAEAKVLSGEDP